MNPDETLAAVVDGGYQAQANKAQANSSSYELVPLYDLWLPEPFHQLL